MHKKENALLQTKSRRVLLRVVTARKPSSMARNTQWRPLPIVDQVEVTDTPQCQVCVRFAKCHRAAQQACKSARDTEFSAWQSRRRRQVPVRTVTVLGTRLQKVRLPSPQMWSPDLRATALQKRSHRRQPLSRSHRGDGDGRGKRSFRHRSPSRQTVHRMRPQCTHSLTPFSFSVTTMPGRRDRDL